MPKAAFPPVASSRYLVVRSLPPFNELCLVFMDDRYSFNEVNSILIRVVIAFEEEQEGIFKRCVSFGQIRATFDEERILCG